MNKKINPFFEELIDSFLEIKQSYTTNEAGIISGKITLSKEKEVYVKIYDNGIRVINKCDTKELSLFTYIICNIRSNIDLIELSPEQIHIKTGFDYTMTIPKLIKLGVISKVNQDPKDYQYWINPNIIFKGDRSSFIIQRLPTESTK